MGKGDGTCGQRSAMALEDAPAAVVTGWVSVPATVDEAAAALARRGREQFRAQVRQILGDATDEQVEQAIAATDARSDDEIIAASQASWADRLQGRLCAAVGLRRTVERAVRENQRNPLMAQIEARHGQDLVVLVEAPRAEDRVDVEYMGSGDSVAARRTSYHTEIYRSTVARFVNKDNVAAPKQWMRVTTPLGLATMLRHERAHELWDNLNQDDRAAFAREIDRHSLHDLVDGLTLYAAKSRDNVIAQNERRGISRYQHPLVLEAAAAESFCELFAMRTHPNWDASAFPAWVGELADRQLRMLGVDPDAG